MQTSECKQMNANKWMKHCLHHGFRLLRICSSQESFKYRIEELKRNFLMPRGYKPKVIDDSFEKLKELPGDTFEEKRNEAPKKEETCDKNRDFCSRRCGSSLPGLRMLDPPLGPPSTWVDIFWHTCLQSHLQTSPPTPQKSYPKFQNPRTNFEIFNKKIQKTYKRPPGGQGVSPNFLGG